MRYNLDISHIFDFDQDKWDLFKQLSLEWEKSEKLDTTLPEVEAYDFIAEEVDKTKKKKEKDQIEKILYHSCT